MKKKIWICIAGVVLLAILFVPIPSGTYKDGGTRAYSALTYKIVKWQRDTGSDVYKATRVYWLPNNFKSIDSLWAGEEAYVPPPLHGHRSGNAERPRPGAAGGG